MQTRASIVSRALQLFAVAAFAATGTYPAYAQQPAQSGAPQADKWFPSKWGADDEIGAANHMTPQRITEAARLVKTGAVYELGITVSPATPLDMAAFFGTDVVKEGTAYNREQIDGAAQKQGVEIREGDVVIFHSGWLSLIESDPKRYGSVEPGLGKEGALYLASKNVMAVGADTWGVEPFRSRTAWAPSRSIRSCSPGTASTSSRT
jgi:hypothetical protein